MNDYNDRMCFVLLLASLYMCMKEIIIHKKLLSTFQSKQLFLRLGVVMVPN
jgi:hypothetical protein